MKFKLNKDKEIVKYDFEQTYKPEDYLKTKNQVQKRQKALNAQIRIYNTEIKKALEVLPKIKDIPEKELDMIWYYRDRQSAMKESEIELKKLDKGIKILDEEMAEIEKQTGIKFEK